jgi:predicted Zn-dependent peptidase
MRSLIVAAALLAAAAPAYADDPNIKFEKFKLANGLEVILAPDPHVPLVAVNVWYHVGSGNEVVGRSGFAHLFEHMMFQGSKNAGMDKHFEILRKIGADEVNGTTNSDRTNYYEVVPSNQLETALWLESDRLGFMMDVLDRKALDNQIDVVRNERRQRYDNVPYATSRLRLYERMYPEGHPYRYTTIGKHEDLMAASVDDVKAFFKTWYVPSNATLAIVGDFDVAEAKKLVNKWFASFPASKKPVTVTVPPPAKQQPSTLSVDDSFAKQRQVTFAWHSPAMYGEGDAELDVAASAISAEGHGSLYKSLVYDKQLATRVGAGQSGAQYSGMFTITVTLRTDADIEAVKKIVIDEVARLARDPIAAKDVARVVASNEAWSIRGLENVNARANSLQGYNHYLGDPGKLTWDLDRYRNTTPEKVRAAVAKFLVPANAVVVITNPTAGTAGAAAGKPAPAAPIESAPKKAGAK